MKMLLLSCLLALGAACNAVGETKGDGPAGTSENADAEQTESAREDEEKMEAKIELTSPKIKPGEPMPVEFTGDGRDESPPLEWTDLPEGTRELALILDDPDAPSEEPWVHWVVYNLSPEAKFLPEGMRRRATLANPDHLDGLMVGLNSWGERGYRGPAPPPGHGPHRYFFRLYALDADLDYKPGLTKAQLLDRIEDRVIGVGELMATYERK